MARKKGARSVPAQLAIGSAADLGFLLVLTAIASALVLSGVIGQGSIPTASLCANALAAFAGSLIAARGFSQRRLHSTLACTAGYRWCALWQSLFVSAPAGMACFGSTPRWRHRRWRVCWSAGSRNAEGTADERNPASCRMVNCIYAMNHARKKSFINHIWNRRAANATRCGRDSGKVRFLDSSELLILHNTIDITLCHNLQRFRKVRIFLEISSDLRYSKDTSRICHW